MSKYYLRKLNSRRRAMLRTTSKAVSARLSRAADLRGSHELPITQEYLSEMLGVSRTSVSVIAHTLQQAGMLKYVRGHIKLLDIPALHETACECYQAVKLNYDALVQPESNVISSVTAESNL